MNAKEILEEVEARHVADGIIDLIRNRETTLGRRGAKRRDEDALEIACGAASALTLALGESHQAAQRVLLMALLIGVRGRDVIDTFDSRRRAA